MDIKIHNIVRKIGTNEVFEVSSISGEILLCRAINTVVPSNLKAVAIKKDEVEVIMDQETDVFNMLFKHDGNS